MQYVIGNTQYEKKQKRLTSHVSRLTKPKGFTLIEILVVTGIFVLVTVMATNMFFTILKSSAKTRILAEVKQNGDYAISVMERAVRNARSVSGSDSSITIQNPPGSSSTFTTFLCGDSNGDSLNDIALDDASLISDKVRVESCTGVFNIVDPGVPDVRPAVVTIGFTLVQAGTVSRPEDRAEITFSTQVTLRNY